MLKFRHALSEEWRSIFQRWAVASRPDVVPAPDRLGSSVVVPGNTRRISRAPVGSWWPWLEREL